MPTPRHRIALLTGSLAIGFVALSARAIDPPAPAPAPSPALAAAAAKSPCRQDARYRSFDYWLGTWNVRRFGAGPEAPLHHNEVTLEQGGCVIQEHWRDARGGTGTSFSMFDASRGIWHQTWVDASGFLAVFEGTPNERGDLVLRRVSLPGDPADGMIRRMSYLRLPEGGVRQLVETSADDGKTWKPTVDFHYRPAGA